MDFLIFYEHEQREIDSIFLLREVLLSKGYTCEISSTNTWGYWRKILFSNPKVVVVPWFRYNENVAFFTAFIRNRNPKIVNLQWEQIYNKRNLELGLTSISGEAIHAVHLCWGEKSYERLLKQNIDPNNLKITGPIHLDLARLHNESIFSREELSRKFHLPLKSKWRLFISSFSYATLPKSYLDNIYKQYGDMSDFVLISKQSRDEIFKWYEYALHKNPEYIYIYRPHPSEFIDKELEALIKKYKNFRVIKDYPIRNWISNVDIIDTWYSTSLAEIYALKKTCYILRPLSIPDEYEVEIMRNASFISTIDSFLQTFNDNSQTFPIKENELKSFYDITDENYAVLRVANVLEEVIRSSSYQYTYKSNLFNTGYFLTFLKIFITSFIGDICYMLKVPLFFTKRLKKINDINIYQRRNFKKKVIIMKKIVDKIQLK